jgi:hypothetical protein
MGNFKKFLVLLILIASTSVHATEITVDERFSKRKNRSSPIEAGDEQISKRAKEEKISDSFVELQNKSLCVHLTDHFPKGGKMIAGATIGTTIIHSKRAMPERSSLHFAWNKPVSVEATADRGMLKRKYAIIETFKALETKWYGGYHDDIVIIGNHKLSKDAIIFVPEGESESLEAENSNTLATIISYPKESTGAKAAEEHIKKTLGITVKSVNPGTSRDWEIEINSDRVKAHAIFELIIGNRHWGIHEESPHGIVDLILGYLNHNFRVAFMSDAFLDELLEPREIERALVLLRYYRQKLGGEIETLSKEIQTFLEERDPVIDKWLGLLELEVDIRKKGKSIFQNKTILHRLMDNLHENTHETNKKIVSELVPLPCLNPKKFEVFYQKRQKRSGPFRCPIDDSIFIKVIMNMKIEKTIKMIAFICAEHPSFKIDFRTLYCIAHENNCVDKMPDFDQMRCLLPDFCQAMPPGISIKEALKKLGDIYEKGQVAIDETFFYGMGFETH